MENKENVRKPCPRQKKKPKQEKQIHKKKSAPLEKWQFQAQQARPRKAKELAPTGQTFTLTKRSGTSRPIKVLGSIVVDPQKLYETGKQHPAEGFTSPSRPQTAISKWAFGNCETGKQHPAEGSLVVDLQKPCKTGTQHPAEGFTGPSRPQTAVTNVTFWTVEKWQAQQARPRKAKELAPTCQTFTLTKRSGTSRPVEVLGNFVVDLQKPCEIGKPDPAPHPSL